MQVNSHNETWLSESGPAMQKPQATGLGLQEEEERVTRTELALSAWEAQCAMDALWSTVVSRPTATVEVFPCLSLDLLGVREELVQGLRGP